MSDQHLRPSRDQEPLETAESTEQVPWEVRSEQGWPRSLVRTVRVFLLSPRKGYASTAPRGGYRGPLLFALLVSLAAGLLSSLTESFYELSLAGEGEGGLGELFSVSVGAENVEGLEWLPASLLSLLSAGGCIVGLLVGIPILMIFLPIIVFIWSGILHLCLKLVGGLRGSEAGFQGTWAAVCYAFVGLFGGVVPVLGDWLVFVWLGALQAIGFWRLHGSSPARAIAALMLPFTIPAVLWLLKWVGWIGEV